MVITDTDAGENDVFYCDSCDYSANSNHAVSKLPEVKTIGDFGQCVSLTSITIPSNVTTIASGTFSGCSGLSFCKILKDTPPTSSGTSAWTNIPSDFQIIYPYASTIAYKSATNYPNISTYLYLGFYTGTDGETLPTTVTDGTTTYDLTWYANTKDAVAETNPITAMQLQQGFLNLLLHLFL